MTPAPFRKLIWSHYRKDGRHSLPWRRTRDPYRILVSEVMLQQTQVDRVIPKYRSFLKKFPTFKALANASLQSVLIEWKGLGYNRRALGLKRAAEAVMKDHNGKLPRDYASLLKLAGIGPYTAHAVRAFAWNEPEVFIETNIRSVYIHHFFDKATPQRPDHKISDIQLMPIIEKTLDTKKPREWYYALMDYGAHLKKTAGNASRKSSLYSRQSKFKGSHRELRALVLHEVAKKKRSTVPDIARAIAKEKAEVASAIIELVQEGFVVYSGKIVSVA